MRVSAIIPVFNGQGVIARAIESVLAQHFDDLEIIAIDDGSTDATLEELNIYRGKIQIISQQNQGAAAARNAGIAAAQGDSIAFLDADDQWLPGKLRRMVALIEANPNAALAFSAATIVNSHGIELPGPPRPWRNLSLDEMLIHDDWLIYTSTVLARRCVLLDCSGFRTEFSAAGFEDIFAWFMMRERGPFAYTAEPLVIYRGPDFADMADKYEHNLRTYQRLLERRYGVRAARTIKTTNRTLANSLAAKAFRQMSDGQYKAAFGTWIKVHRYNPFFTITGGNLRRLVRPKSLKNLARMLLEGFGFISGPVWPNSQLPPD